jgi:hypothetical protein
MPLKGFLCAWLTLIALFLALLVFGVWLLDHGFPRSAELVNGVLSSTLIYIFWG